MNTDKIRTKLLKEIDEHLVYTQWETDETFNIPQMIRDYSKKIINSNGGTR